MAQPSKLTMADKEGGTGGSDAGSTLSTTNEGGDIAPQPPGSIAVEEAGDVVSPLDMKKRKLSEKGHTASKSWRQHFRALEEFNYSKSGKKGHRLGFCLYCLEASSETPSDEQLRAMNKHRFGRQPKPPGKIQIYQRNCVSHLRTCMWVPSDISKEFREDAKKMKNAPSPSISMGSLGGSVGGSVASATGSADIRSFAVPRGLTAAEIPTFQKLCLNLVVDTHNPFTFPKEPSFAEVCEFLRPGSSDFLPSRFVVSGRLLNQAAEEAQRADDYFIQKAKERGYLRAIAIDGWKDQSKLHVEGIVNLYGAESYLEPSEISGSEHHGIAVAKMLENMYLTREDDLWSIVTDEAGQCSRAKRIVNRRFPHFLLNKCWAHQVNLMVNALLSLPEFAGVTDQACKIATTLNTSSSKWAVRFYDVVDQIYVKNTTLRILTMGQTRWNSAQAMFGSQLRVMTAFKVFHAQWSASDDWPKAFNAVAERSFWPSLAKAELLI